MDYEKFFGILPNVKNSVTVYSGLSFGTSVLIKM